MKKTILSIAILSFATQAIAFSAADLMNLSNEQQQTITDHREQQRQAELARQQQLEAERLAAQQQMQQQQVTQSIKQEQIAPPTYNVEQPNLDSIQLNVAPQNNTGVIKINNDSELQNLIRQSNAQQRNAQAMQQQAVQVQKQNTQKMQDAFGQIQKQVKEMADPFPQLKQNNQ